jgi:hypothetical protein
MVRSPRHMRHLKRHLGNLKLTQIPVPQALNFRQVPTHPNCPYHTPHPSHNTPFTNSSPGHSTPLLHSAMPHPSGTSRHNTGAAHYTASQTHHTHHTTHLSPTPSTPIPHPSGTRRHNTGAVTHLTVSLRRLFAQCFFHFCSYLPKFMSFNLTVLATNFTCYHYLFK